MFTFFGTARAQLGPRPPPFEVSSSHTITHKHKHTHTHTHTHVCARGRTPLKERSSRRSGLYPYNMQQTQQTNIHTLSGSRTHNPSNRAATWIVNSYLYQHQNVTLLNEGTTGICWTLSSPARCSKQNSQSLLSYCIISSSTALLTLFISVVLFHFLWRIYYVSTDSAYVQ